MTSKNDNPSSYVTRIRGLKESPQDIALRALRAITKSNKSAIQLENVPNDFLFGENVDLQRWTIVLKDKDLKELSEQQNSGKKYYLDGSATTLSGVFAQFSTPQLFPNGLMKLNIAAAKDVTDYGLAMIARKSPSLSTLILTGCTQITDLGLREVGMHCTQLQYLNISSCPGIDGVGIAAIAECCPYLTKLNLSKNTIKNWSLQKIFRKCQKLEELNISYMKDITDEEIRIVAETCRDLLIFEAIDCVYLSDQALLTLSQHCKDLDYVDLSRNEMSYRITDVTLMALGQRCHSLRTLKMNRCDHISDVGLHWLSEGCKLLETLEFYGCNKITDAGLRILGKECHALTAIDISLAKSISDVGIANLAKGCKLLSKLKCHGAFLLSDPRFFAENIQNHIPISAKDQLSEEDFDVINTSTTLLTSKSASALSVESSSVLSGEEGGGMSGLLEGSLPSLKTLNTRKGIPKKLEIWEESIGIVALVHSCPQLSHLDLSGCFRLNRVLGKSVSRLTELRVLNLKGCNQVTAPSLCNLFKSLSLLQEVNLTDCGKGVNNDVLQKLSESCLQLKFLYLSRCHEITGKGIKAIANIPLLEKLDLSGCKYLNDSRMVYLVSSDKVKYLQSLDISNIPKMTDSFLAWISMKDHRLLYLSLKGTEMTNKALLSVKDRFPFCDLLMNDNYYGFWPKFRVMDRLLINQYARMIRGIITCQSRVRKMMATRRVLTILQERKIVNAHLLLHRIVRGFLARCRVKKMIEWREMMHHSAEKVTSLFHANKAKKRVVRIKRNRHQRYLHEQAIIIQCIFRQYRARKQVKAIRYQLYLLQQRKIRAAIVIQSVIRMYLGKCTYYRKKAMKRKQFLFINQRASYIQRMYRGYYARIHVAKMKQVLFAYQRQRRLSAIRLQRAYRSYRTRRILAERIARKRLQYYAAVLIQALGRGFTQRLHYSELVYEKVLKQKTVAAVKIQCIYRVYIAKKIFFAKIRAIHQRKKQCLEASNRIVLAARLKLARMELRRRRQAYYQRMKEQTQHTIACCVKIQAMMRRYLCQKHYYAKLALVKNQWKELFDESKKKRFFYNKLTGEIRWKIPQDLLDLIPNPKCDNCQQIDAMIECRQCQEMFCADCFRTIHYNGRRKEHEFRSLYDYYGKRMDYGDGDEEDDPNYHHRHHNGPTTTVQNGKVYYISSDSESDSEEEKPSKQQTMQTTTANKKSQRKPRKSQKEKTQDLYPCQWPTEIIQDQIQGWMLRIAPYRKPFRVYAASGWEEYQFNDDDYQQLQRSIDNIKTSEEQRRMQKLILKSCPTTFYFNRKTFETKYEMPEEVRQEQIAATTNRFSTAPAPATATSSSFLFSSPQTNESQRYNNGGGDPNLSFYGSPYEPYHQMPTTAMDPNAQSFLFQTPGGSYRNDIPPSTAEPPQSAAYTMTPASYQDPMMQTRGSSVMGSRGGNRHQMYYYPAYYYQQPGFNATTALKTEHPIATFSKDSSHDSSGLFSGPPTAASHSFYSPAPNTAGGFDPNSQNQLQPVDPNNYYYYYYYPSGPTTAGNDISTGPNSNLQTPYHAPSTQGGNQYWYGVSAPGTAQNGNVPAEAMGFYDEYGQWQWYDYSQYYPQITAENSQENSQYYYGNYSAASQGTAQSRPATGSGQVASLSNSIVRDNRNFKEEDEDEDEEEEDEEDVSEYSTSEEEDEESVETEK